MNLILFIHQDSSKKGTTLKKIIDQTFTGIEIQTLQTFNTFKARLKQASNYNKEIFVLFADSKKRLNDLKGLIDLLDNKRLILILPDDSKATMSTVHRFFPRYFTYVTDTYTDLCDVISKMINPKNINNI
ncbi:MAG: hypothetical protein L3J69_01600 [Desulfobacula sp.]|nr:hypothetical protein [Desulfobacula sp.]